MKLKPEWWVLCAIIVFAGVVRLYALDGSPVIYDEAFSWRMAHFSTEELIKHVPADAHPPLYYLMLKGWRHIGGDSILALRALSVLFGVLSVPLIYALCGEAERLDLSARSIPRSWTNAGGLLSAFLLAAHGWQASYGRTARMYSVGVFLAGLSAWFLLKAVRARDRRLAWWTCYGCTAALFAYTHYFALFTIFAQALFLLGLIVTRWWRPSNGSASRLALYSGFAFALFFILCIPWLQVFARQVEEVRQGFWIPRLTLPRLQEMIFSWSTGLLPKSGAFPNMCLAMLGAALAYSMLRPRWNLLFFLLQALMPWVMSIALYGFTGRSILLERYLAFSGFFLLAFWGALINQLPAGVARFALAISLALLTLAGTRETAMFVRGMHQRVVYEEVMPWLKNQHRPGDIILTTSPADFCLIRYYLAQAEVPLDVKVAWDDGASEGHALHAAALTSSDMFVPERYESGSQRIWLFEHAVGAKRQVPKRFHLSRRHEFHHPEGDRLSLLLLEPGER
jgi:hypothetical protein